MWIFLVTEIMFFGGLFRRLRGVSFDYPQAFAAGSRLCEIALGAINTAVLISSSLTMALAVRPHRWDAGRQSLFLLFATMLLGTAFLGSKFRRVWPQVRGAPDPGQRLRLRGTVCPAGSALRLLLLCDDRPACAAHGDRDRAAGGDGGAGRARALSRRPTTLRWKWPACTGISWIWSGSFCSRCSIWWISHKWTPHILSLKKYFGVYAALIALTVATVAIASFDLGRLNVVFALAIAAAKAALVGLFFMHLIYTSHRTKIMAVAGLVWLAILIALTLSGRADPRLAAGIRAVCRKRYGRPRARSVVRTSAIHSRSGDEAGGRSASRMGARRAIVHRARPPSAVARSQSVSAAFLVSRPVFIPADGRHR